MNRVGPGEILCTTHVTVVDTFDQGVVDYGKSCTARIDYDSTMSMNLISNLLSQGVLLSQYLYVCTSVRRNFSLPEILILSPGYTFNTCPLIYHCTARL